MISLWLLKNGFFRINDTRMLFSREFQ